MMANDFFLILLALMGVSYLFLYAIFKIGQL